MGYCAEPRLGNIWSCMKQRCNNPKHTAAKWYHDKGIRVCEEWNNSFSAFQKWAHENGYQDGLTIDRIDPEKDYSPENCRWVTPKENSSRKYAGKDNGIKRAPTEIPTKSPRKRAGRKYTAYGIDIKTRLLKAGKTQEWLIGKVRESTGMFFDDSYLYKILIGERSPTKIMQAIDDIMREVGS